ncbi:MAG: type II secretion system F family protein [Verrucomicrobia bacterium]|nr:type II secretion system F family protein [Verrucomicrobiota bacterium]
MSTFTYTARDRKGDRRNGEIEERDRRAAVTRVRSLGLTPITVVERAGSAALSGKTPTPKKTTGPAKPKSAAKPPAKTSKTASKRPQKASAGRTLLPISKRGVKLPLRVVLQFSVDLRDLLSAGMTLGTCIHKLSRQSGSPQRSALLKMVHEDIVQGKSLSEALAKHPRSFPEFYTSIIRAGEAGGQLQQSLENAVRHYERAAAAREQLIGALVYPCIVAGFGFLTLIGCFIFVIPQFTGIFTDMGQQLPGPTMFLIHTSNFLRRFGWLLVLMTALIVAGFQNWKATANGRYAWHAFMLKMPLFSRVIRANAYANFARTLSNLLTNGVPVLRALDIVRNTLGNAVLEREVGDLKNRVTDGSSLSRPLAESGIFPDLFTDMLAVGEESGEVPRALAQIARRYDDELNRSIKIFTTAIEPILMIFIAGAVAFVAISMLLPVFQLSQGIR